MGTIKVKTKQKETVKEEVVLRVGDVFENSKGDKYTLIRNVSAGKFMALSESYTACNISEKCQSIKVLYRDNNKYQYRYTHQQETIKEVIKEKAVEVNTGATLTMIEIDGIEVQHQVFGNNFKSFSVDEKGDIMYANDAPFQYLLDYYSNNFEITGVSH
jgi:hypothetical protein